MTREIADHPKRPSRRLAAVVLGILGVVGLGIGSASQVTLAANPLGAGATTIAPCQTSGPIGVTFTTDWYTNGVDSYRATRVTLSGIDAACGQLGVRITILDTSGNAIAGLIDLPGTVPTDGGSVVSQTFAQNPVAGIGQVAIVIQ